MDENLEVMSEESVEEQEVAEPVEEDVTNEEESVETQEVAEPVKEVQSKEENARYASIRRQAEAEAQRKFDSQISKMCEGVVHPITGKPITTFAEYEDAVHAQSRLQAEQTLKENNVDTDVLDAYINNNPMIRQAQAILEEQKAYQAEQKVRSDMDEIMALDPSIQTIEDLAKMPTWNNMLDRVSNGMSLVDAYKLENYDALITRGKESAKQSAVNMAKGKSHLESTDSLSGDNDDVDVPQEILAQFPDKSVKEIKKLYKQIYR